MASGSDPPVSISDTPASTPEGRPSESLREIIRQELAAALRNVEVPTTSSAAESGKFGLWPPRLPLPYTIEAGTQARDRPYNFIAGKRPNYYGCIYIPQSESDLCTLNFFCPRSAYYARTFSPPLRNLALSGNPNKRAHVVSFWSEGRTLLGSVIYGQEGARY